MPQINIRIDEELKRSAEQVLDDIGMPMSTAITIFLKKVSRERRIPFELTADPFYSESNMKYLEGIVKDMETGKAHFSEHDLIEVD
ncbi:MAG: type II toxin-antitoxin system RelB/DinJ family antitoxin [Oscillospiraceae bacterium]